MYMRPYRPPMPPRRRARRRARLHAALAFALTLALGICGCMLQGRRQERAATAYQPAAQAAASAPAPYQLPANVTDQLPQGAAQATVTYSLERLAAGRMMRIDREHPLPAEAAAPNTFNILRYTQGRVSCQDTYAVLGDDALTELDALFASARREGIALLTVAHGCVSPAQQKEKQIEHFCQLAQELSLEDALAQTLREIDPPGTSEHQTPWAVDIRVCDSWNRPPRSEPLSASPEGRWLIDNCWRYGLIWRYGEDSPHPDPSCGAYHFRYVGKAHAAMMHALGLALEDYLTFLHSNPVLTLWDGQGQPRYSVLCGPAETSLTLSAPMKALLEDVSLDNLGWGVAAYSWPQAAQGSQ